MTRLSSHPNRKHQRTTKYTVKIRIIPSTRLFGPQIVPESSHSGAAFVRRDEEGRVGPGRERRRGRGRAEESRPKSRPCRRGERRLGGRPGWERNAGGHNRGDGGGRKEERRHIGPHEILAHNGSAAAVRERNAYESLLDFFGM